MKIKSIKNTDLPPKKYIFLTLQLLILFAAVLVWLFNRGNAFQKIFSLDELTVADCAVTAKDIFIDSTLSEGGQLLETPPLTLEKGIYQILVDYSASGTGSYVTAHTDQLGPMEFRCSNVTLDSARSTAVMTLELSRGVSDLTVEAFFSGSGSVSILNISVTETSNLYKKNLFNAFLLCLLIDLVWIFQSVDAAGRKVICALSVIFLASCYPLFTDYITVGQDIPFHLLRIEGLAEGLRLGNGFPVKIHPLWARGYGYAVGVLYGDALLYFPASLRLLGFSVQSAYKIFVAAINLGTVIISYFSFKRMFRSRKIGVLGCMLYSMALYRLIDTYTRAAVGEFSAMMFLPLVLCAFYLIFTEASEKNWLKYAVLTSLGLTGLIQSHVLSCEMAAIVILITCILLIRRVFRRYTFQSLAMGALFTLLLNVGFLVPFLDYYGGDLYIHSEQWSKVSSFQDNGLFPVQLFSLFQHSNGGAWSTQAGVYDEMTVGIGIAFLLGCLLFFYLLLCHFKEVRSLERFRPACLCLAMGSLLLFMTTCFFPWDGLVSIGGSLAKTLTSSLQFPWRLLAPATVLLTFAICFACSSAFQILDLQAAGYALLTILLLMAVNTGWYLYDFAFTGQPYRVYSTTDLDTMAMYSHEYLPEAVDPLKIQEGMRLQENITLIESYQKQGTDILCRVTTGNAQGYIDFPLNYYKYYVCKTASGKELSVSAGYNGMLRVAFPADFEDDIQITFREPWHWRLSEAVSLITLLACVVILLLYRRRAVRQGK